MPSSRFRRALDAALALTVLAGMSGTASAHAARHCRGANVTPNAAHLAKARRATLCLLNSQRRHHGLRPVRPSLKLRRASEQHSRSMVRHRYFAHGAYYDRIVHSGYLRHASFWVVGENIAWGGGSLATPAQIMNMWMHSPPHRANILSRDYRNVGIGIAAGTPEAGVTGATYTTDFGRRG